MNRKTLGGSVVMLGLFGVGAFAQGVVAKNFPFRGHPLSVPIDPGCFAVSSQLTDFRGNAWLVVTCDTGKLLLLRYPNEPATAPVPTLGESCTVPGMVTSVYGGCVDKNHPSAPNATRK